jgi:hypothetical protein
MDPTERAEDDFVMLGVYSPHEASRLLERFDQSGIEFRAKTRRTPYYLKTEILVSVDRERASDADAIHRDLFGDGLPNYDSSFFRGRRNV